jgi:hypothetical protein
MIALERHDPHGVDYEALALGIGGGLLILALTFPLWREWYPFACGLKTITGFPCALCGGTRAVSAWVLGRPVEAWITNPLATTIAALATLYLPYAGFCVATRRPQRLRLVGLGPSLGRLRWAVRFALLAVVLLNWAYLIHAGR